MREREKKEEEMDNEIRRRGKKCSRDGVVKYFVKIFSKNVSGRKKRKSTNTNAKDVFTCVKVFLFLMTTMATMMMIFDGDLTHINENKTATAH